VKNAEGEERRTTVKNAEMTSPPGCIHNGEERLRTAKNAEGEECLTLI